MLKTFSFALFTAAATAQYDGLMRYARPNGLDISSSPALNSSDSWRNFSSTSTYSSNQESWGEAPQPTPTYNPPLQQSSPDSFDLTTVLLNATQTTDASNQINADGDVDFYDYTLDAEGLPQMLGHTRRRYLRQKSRGIENHHTTVDRKDNPYKTNEKHHKVPNKYQAKDSKQGWYSPNMQYSPPKIKFRSTALYPSFAVCELPQGKVQIGQLKNRPSVAKGTLSGLNPWSTYKLTIHENGTLGNKCDAVGNEFNPM